MALATAIRFVAEGAYVFIIGRQKELDATVKAIGSNLTGVQGDVANLSNRVCRNRQRLPSNVLIKNASTHNPAPSRHFSAEAFPIEATDDTAKWFKQSTDRCPHFYGRWIIGHNPA